MGKYIMKLDSTYDERLGYNEGGKQTSSRSVTSRNLSECVMYIQGLYTQGIKLFTPDGSGNYVYNGITYEGDGYYLLTTSYKGKYNLVGSEAINGSAYTVYERTSDNFRIYDNEVETCRFDQYPRLYFYSGTTLSGLVDSNAEMSDCRFVDVPGGNYVKEPKPGVALVVDTQEDVNEICYNEYETEEARPIVDKLVFQDSAGTYDWQDYGITDEWYDSICDYLRNPGPYGNKPIEFVESVCGLTPEGDVEVMGYWLRKGNSGADAYTFGEKASIRLTYPIWSGTYSVVVDVIYRYSWGEGDPVRIIKVSIEWNDPG